MNKFEEYNASFIEPQHTLIKKFNFLVKYLKENPTYNVYMSSDNFNGGQYSYSLENVALHGNTLKTGDAIVFNNALVCFVDAVGENSFTANYGTNIQGIQGEQGMQGEQGISITNVEINNLGHLIITLSNSQEIDAGLINKTILISGKLGENLDVEVEITEEQYNEFLNNPNVILKFLDTNNNYAVFLTRRMQEETNPLESVTFEGTYVNITFNGIVKKVETEEETIEYYVAISCIELATKLDLEEKQDVLTFDNTPTQNSDNPVKSGGVYSALGNKQNNLTPSSVNDGTINKVLGFDSSNNLVKGAVSSGGKVYMHKLDFPYPGGNYAHCVLYSASNVPFSLQTLNRFLNNNNINNMSSGIPFWLDSENSFSILTDSNATPYITTVVRRLFGDVGTPALCYRSSKKEITIDTTNNKIIFSAPSSSTQYLSVSSLTDTVIEI